MDINTVANKMRYILRIDSRAQHIDYILQRDMESGCMRLAGWFFFSYKGDQTFAILCIYIQRVEKLIVMRLKGESKKKKKIIKKDREAKS